MNDNLDIQVFTNDALGSIRTIVVNEEPWFVLSDVCKSIGLSNPTTVATRIDDDERSKFNLGRQGNATIVNESGLYAVILRSDKPKAKSFRKWVTSEVLPSIRKTGGYVNNEDLFINTYLPFADDNTKMLFRTTLNTINQLNHKIEQDKPLVEFAEHIQTSDDCISMNDMAKLACKNGIKIGRNKLFAFLRKNKVLKSDNIPYQRYIGTQPWFQIKESTYGNNNSTHLCLTTLVTTKGQQGIIKMLKKN